MTQEPQMNTSTPAPWFVRHFAITLYTWFFFGMALCGLLVPPERVAVLEADVERLSVAIAALGSDPLAIERAIREDLELARPGEWVVRFASAANDRPGL